MTRVWVLNLDAEEELAAPRAYRPTARTAALVRTKREFLRGSLVQPGDRILDGDAPAADPRRALRDECTEEGVEVKLWSPTPTALAAVRRAGLPLPEAPALDVLREVNARPFTARLLGRIDPGGLEKRVALDLEEALAALARAAEHGWLVRRTFGAAGRGRRRIATGRPDEAELAWLRASLRIGPLTIEPFVRVEREFTRSGTVDRLGRVSLRAPCLQTTDRHGAWTGSESALATEVPGAIDDGLKAAFEEAGRALHRSGYFGPFGVDAFLYREAGTLRLQPLSEINARYTMDWSESERTGLPTRSPFTARPGTR